MLSHIVGRAVHATAEEVSELKARVADLQMKIANQRQSQTAKLDEWDRRIAVLEAATTCLRGQSLVKQDNSPSRRPEYRRQSVRPLTVARERARIAEARITDLEAQLASLRSQNFRLRCITQLSANPDQSRARESTHSPREPSKKITVLYLGGRSGGIGQLKHVAEEANFEFLHHDGGQEEAFARIGGLVSQCQVVFCPVTCISHRACLHAKDLCRRQNKKFIPLRSTGVASFEQALHGLDVVPQDQV